MRASARDADHVWIFPEAALYSMSNVRSTAMNRWRLLLTIVCVLICSHAAAVCLSFPGHLRVGADPVNCQYNDIQSAINAAAECPVIIDITREHTYTTQHLTIDNKANVTLQGWGDGVTCAQIPNFFGGYAPPDSTAPLVELDGSNDGNGRVLSITGTSNVSVRNLTIENGSAADSFSGGGISFDGQGSLELTRSTVRFNNAGYGAGINVNGNSGLASLTLDPNTLIILNTASTSGGGIRMQGNSHLYALQPQTLIAYNHAPNGYGGGLEVLGPARADIGSPGYGGLGVIYDNDAQYGGGIDILTFDDNQNAIVRLFTTDPNNPVQISGNFASHTGGAVYLKPLQGVLSSASSVLCAYDFRIDDNAAQEGAAIYSDAEYSLNFSQGGATVLNSSLRTTCAKADLSSEFGAVSCAAGVPCNQFVGNKAQDQNGQATAGSTILLQSPSYLIGDRFIARANTGAHLLRQVSDSDGEADLSNCLLVGNVLTQELIAKTGGNEGSVTVNSCTIVGNQIGAPYVFLAPGTMGIYNSIIDQPGRATVDPVISDPYYVAYVLSNDTSTLANTFSVHAGEPTFVDAANGNYHLAPTSLGVDFAPTGAGAHSTPEDLDGHPRVVELPGVVNSYGPLDLGAYEIQRAFFCGASDTIFCDGFQSQ
jgi:hypothetical protein